MYYFLHSNIGFDSHDSDIVDETYDTHMMRVLMDLEELKRQATWHP